ncbi:RHS repeat-associated core domain-containing protein [Chitinophaga sancti]|uniref:RHS repeat domain-containing protein n=1 Tax=Chitinophaga sancti TaxID=1004 RepID=UPI003F78D618
MVYDTRDRLVFSQDEVQRKKSPNEWMVVYYDAYDRANMTGIYKSGKSRSDLLTDMNAIGAQVNLIPYASPYSADLTISSYDGRSAYIASRSIEFVPGFTTSDNSNFVAYIDNTTGGNIIELQSINPVPNINAADITPLTYIYYDDYGFTGQSAFSNAEAVNLNAGSNPYAEAFPTAYSKMTKGLITGSRVRVIGTDKWLTTTNYYDDKARIVQLIADNAVGGKDVLTSQYDFSGKVLSTFHRHSNPKSPVTPQMTILTMNSYDHAGRLLTAVQQLNGDAANQVTIASNTYNELGEIGEKRLAILPDGRQLDVMKYTYNVRGWLSGINPAYVNGIGSSDNWFGEEVSYDQGFAEQQFNSNLSGVKWKSRADGTPRAYGLKYDDTGRLTTADFTQQTNGAAEWTQDKVDFSVSGLSYDENGNIQKMIQKGMIGTGSRIIDNMTYSYDPAGSNKLNAVSDNVNTASAKLGDFIDGNKSDVDYTYDANGNLVEDRNKGISKITYNHLNQPTLIEVTGKGTIAYQYDANGQKLNKTVKDNSDPGAPVVRTTDYIGGFIYELDTLKQINFQDGRIRPIVKQGEPVRYTYDYFEKDHLGNVRVVLGTLADSSIYAATIEMNNAEKENALFNNIENTRVVLPAGYPADPTTNPNSAVARLNSQGQKIGPSIVLRVMAGDTIRAAVKAFYKSVGNNTSDATPASMLSALAQAFSNTVITEGPHAGISGNTGIESAFTEAEYNQVMTRDPYNFDPGKPRAYLSYVFFDDMFNLVDDNSGFKQVSGAPDELQSLVTNRMVAKKSGYLYIYVSNESADYVYFDNMIVVHNQGPLLEETHYYPFGLTMEGISRKGLRGPAYINNRNKFNGIEHTTELDMNQYDAYFRTLDPQIGRWWQIDPKPSDWESPYVAMGNNPSRYSDFLGDTLMPTGEGVSEFKNVVGEQTGGFYKAIVSKGILILKPTGKKGTMTPAQQAFYDQMDEVIKGHKFEMEFVRDDPMVTGGNFDLGKVDINDVKKMKDGPVFNSASGLIHEIVEQYFKELEYDAAHIKGLDAEEKITGYRRDDESQQNKVVNDEHGTTIITKLKYYKGEEMREIIIGINGGNIVNVLTK